MIAFIIKLFKNDWKNRWGAPRTCQSESSKVQHPS